MSNNDSFSKTLKHSWPIVFAFCFGFVLLVTIMAYFSVAPNLPFVVIVAASFSGLLVILCNCFGIKIQGKVWGSGREFQGASSLIVFVILTTVFSVTCNNLIREGFVALSVYLNGKTEIRTELINRLDVITEQIEADVLNKDKNFLGRKTPKINQMLKDSLVTDLTKLRMKIEEIHNDFSAKEITLTEREQSQISYAKAMVAHAINDSKSFEELTNSMSFRSNEFSHRHEFLKCKHLFAEISRTSNSGVATDFSACREILGKLSVHYPNDRSIEFLKAQIEFRLGDYKKAAQLYSDCRLHCSHKLFPDLKPKFDELLLVQEATCLININDAKALSRVRESIEGQLADLRSQVEKEGNLLDLEIYLMTWSNYQELFQEPIPEADFEWMQERAWKTEHQELIRDLTKTYADRSSILVTTTPDLAHLNKFSESAVRLLSTLSDQNPKDLQVASYVWELLANCAFLVYARTENNPTKAGVLLEVAGIAIEAHDKSQQTAAKLKNAGITEQQYNRARELRESLIPTLVR